MRRVAWLLVGASVACASTVFWMRSFQARDQERLAERVDGYLTLSDEELLAREPELKSLDGLEGRVMLALLACVGNRARKPHSPAQDRKAWQAPPQIVHVGSARGASAAPTVAAALGPVATDTQPAPRAGAPVDPPPPAASASASSGSSARGDRFSFPPTPDFFCKTVRGAPTLVDDAGLAQAFPFDSGSEPFPESFGVLDGEADETATLDAHVCETPNFWEDTPARHAQSAFFRLTRGKLYEGQLAILGQPPAGVPREYRVHLHFNPRSQDRNREYLAIFRNGGGRAEDLFENRYTRYEKAHPVWRYNPCQRSVALVSTQCPWGSVYDREYKDFFALAGGRKLGVNVYCRRRVERTWVRIGRMLLAQSASG